ncbi:MAG: 2-oxoglutarate dehydrogenase, E2 component, dihydrolipoamide succinyltransferase, partial [Planctomycetota bacterium]|nr:2-oxoglutarate dehydrogenase, E2 component, dihydrolipoamide succinyltransferase [Planctomycetota bacterium]
ILAAARGKAATPKPAPAKAGGKLSTAEILAAARGKAAAKPAAEAPAKAEPEAAPEVAAEPAPEPAAETAAPAAAAGPLPTTTAEKIAWCRQHDAKG